MSTLRNEVYLIHKNGRWVYGPPDDWVDAVPSYHCELFIKNLPKEINEKVFLDLLQRFGIVYQFRLMIDSSKLIRGYAFTRYTIELDALAAMELLNRYFLLNGERLKVCKSLNKRSLYVANIPKQLSYKCLHRSFLELFPKMRKLLIHSSNLMENRGFAFLEFGSHEDALEAKKRYTSTGIYLWGTELKIVWAQVQARGITKSKNTLFVRGVNSEHNKFTLLNKLQSIVTPTEINALELVENVGIITFNDPVVASRAYFKMKTICAPELSIEWAKSSSQGWITKQSSDYCAELRMICIANGWDIPVILFGRNYRKNNVQYGSVLLSDGNSNFSSFLMEVITINVYDIQSTMCELVVGVINKVGGFPKQKNVVYKVTNRSGHQVHVMKSLFEPFDVEVDRIRDWKSILEMASTLYHISNFSDEQIFSFYRNSFLPQCTDAIGCMNPVFSNCLAVYPKYRNKLPLNFNLNDTEIVVVLQENTSDERLPPMKYINEHDDNTIRLSWKRKPDGCTFNYIDAGRCDFYHPSQRFNVPPIWIPGHTYRQSVKNFIL